NLYPAGGAIGVNNVAPFASPSVSPVAPALLLGAFAPGFPESVVTITPGAGWATATEEVHGDGAWVASVATRTVQPGTYQATWSLANAATSDLNYAEDLIALSVAPAVTIPGTVAVPEGNTGSSAVLVPVTLSSPSVQTVTVSYSIAAGTATAGSDFS